MDRGIVHEEHYGSVFELRLVPDAYKHVVNELLEHCGINSTSDEICSNNSLLSVAIQQTY